LGLKRIPQMSPYTTDTLPIRHFTWRRAWW
jgi:hypothetical protein